jgi:hypothetical protein
MREVCNAGDFGILGRLIEIKMEMEMRPYWSRSFGGKCRAPNLP